MSVIRSRTVPWPPVILAIMSLPQRMKALTPAIRMRTMASIMMVIIRRALDFGFFSFFSVLDFWWDLVGSSSCRGSNGARKSSALAIGLADGLTSFVVSSRISSPSTEISSESSDMMIFFAFSLGFIVVGLLILGVVSGSAEEKLCSPGFLVCFFSVEEERGDFALRGTSPSIDLFVAIMYNYSIMAIKLTKKQLAVLNFIEDFMEENGLAPTYREIMSGLELASVSAVAEHVDNLVEKGVLKKTPGAARTLEVLDYKHEDTVELFRMKMATCTEDEKKVLEKAMEILDL